MKNRTSKDKVVVRPPHGDVEIYGKENGAPPQDCQELFKQLLANEKLNTTEGNPSVLVTPTELRIYSLLSSSISDETIMQLADILRRNTTIRRLFLKNCDTNFVERVIAELEKEFIFPPELINGDLAQISYVSL